MFRAITNSLLSLAFPQHCLICGRTVEDLNDGVACASCWAATRMFSPEDTLCIKCGNLLHNPIKFEARCHECGDHSYDVAVAAGVYEHALAATVLALKTIPSLPKRAGKQLVSALERVSHDSSTVLIPVPLSAKRAIERGFNQAEVLARHISKRTGMQVDTLSLVRSKHTPKHRAAMDRKARETTVKNVFEVTRPRLIEGRQILLVDDIFTTGATASYCAKELKANGASSVAVITLARAVKTVR
jgi:ComF family protein